MTRRTITGGRFEVSGPGHETRGAQDVSQGLSVAQTWAEELLGSKDEGRKFYVTAVGGDPQACVELLDDGSVISYYL